MIKINDKYKINMKIYKVTVLICMFCILQNISYAQKSKINGTYDWDITKYLSITGDSFKLYLYPTEPFLYGLNIRDIILAEGKVEYESKNFIKLTSKNYEREVEKNMTVVESIDSCLKDSIKFNFIFPFDGKYKLILDLGKGYEDIFTYEVNNEREVIFPFYRDSISTFRFTIVNQTPVKFYFYNYLKNITFRTSRYTFKNNNSNSFEISIPDLTNSYFNRYLINGEYIKVSKEKDVLFWQNEDYRKPRQWSPPSAWRKFRLLWVKNKAADL